MLIEVCFIDTYEDMIKYERSKENLANAIATGITNSSFEPNNCNYEASSKNEWNLGWNQNSTGWWYCTDNIKNYFYRDVWKLIDGEWYYFDDYGYARQNSWLQYCGKWYYLKASCKMARNEWLWINGECYCFNDYGQLYINTTTPDGYKVDETGAWIQ